MCVEDIYLNTFYDLTCPFLVQNIAQLCLWRISPALKVHRSKKEHRKVNLRRSAERTKDHRKVNLERSDEKCEGA